MLITIKPNEEYSIWKRSVDLNSDNKDVSIRVEEGCIVHAVCETTGISKYMEGMESNYDGIYNIFTKDYRPKTRFFAKPEPIMLDLYCANKNLSDVWGVGGIPYLDEDGSNTFVGCHGSMTLRLEDVSLAYKKLTMGHAIKEGEQNVRSEAFWNLVHSDLDAIIKRNLTEYYEKSIRRDGGDFDAYEKKIINEFNKQYRVHGINLEKITVYNLIDPVKKDNSDNNKAKSLKTSDEAILEAAKERAEKERLKEEKEKENKIITCKKCGAQVIGNIIYCPRCGYKVSK